MGSFGSLHGYCNVEKGTFHLRGHSHLPIWGGYGPCQSEYDAELMALADPGLPLIDAH